MTKSIRCISFLLCFVLLFFAFAGPFRQQAQAVAIVDDIIVAIILAVAAASGIAIQSNGFSTVGDFILDKLAEFGQTIGKTWADIQDAFSVRNWLVLQGALSIGSALSDLVTSFLDWVRTEYGLTDNTDVPIISPSESQYYLGEYPCYLLPLTLSETGKTTLSVYADSDYPVYVIASTGIYGSSLMAFFWFSRYPFIGHTAYDSTVNNVGTANSGTYYYSVGGGGAFSSSYPWLSSVTSLTRAEFEALLASNVDVSSTPGSIDFVNAGVGTMDIPLVDDPASDDGLTLTFPGSQVLTIDDIIAIIEAAVTSAYPTIEVEETPANELPEEMDYPTVGLTDVFPFCIPFDLYAFFSVLAADPVAPHFEIPFQIEGLVDYTFVIDLSGFDTVAQILRTMELLLFCVGLVLITRNQIRG